MSDAANKQYKDLMNEFMKNKVTTSDLPNVINRIKQESKKEYGLVDRIDDALFSRGIGSGSEHTKIEEDKANARAALMQYIREPKNLEAFNNLPQSQKEGITSLIKGGL
jgi:hypothetical protein